MVDIVPNKLLDNYKFKSHKHFVSDSWWPMTCLNTCKWEYVTHDMNYNIIEFDTS